MEDRTPKIYEVIVPETGEASEDDIQKKVDFAEDYQRNIVDRVFPNNKYMSGKN